MQKPDCVLIDTENIAGMDVSMNEWISERYEKYAGNIVSDFSGKVDKKGRYTFEWKHTKVADWTCKYDTVLNWYKSVEVITESRFTSELKKIGLYKTEKRGTKFIVGIRKPPQELRIYDDDDDDDDDEYDG